MAESLRIAIYYQNNLRSVFIESLILELKKYNDVYLYTTCPKGEIHFFLESLGIETFSVNPLNIKKCSPIEYVYQGYKLHRFCRQKKIKVILSHLQFSNLIASIYSRISGLITIPCRHHIDASFLSKSLNGKLQDKLVSFFSRKQVVVSKQAKDFMIREENASATKIKYIPLGYNFSLYPSPERKKVELFKMRFSHKYKLIMISRHIASKRHDLGLNLLRKLLNKGLDVGLVILDSGPTTSALMGLASKLEISNNVYFEGYQSNVINHLASCHLLLLPSIQESSNQVVKEAALLSIPSFVCSGIGDFDDYMKHKKNCFIVDRESFVEKGSQLLFDLFSNNDWEESLCDLGENAKNDVLKLFAIEPVAKKYLNLIENINER
jgi:glycosyltransferase involved in cell wall biosynthesis